MAGDVTWAYFSLIFVQQEERWSSIFIYASGFTYHCCVFTALQLQRIEEMSLTRQQCSSFLLHKFEENRKYATPATTPWSSLLSVGTSVQIVYFLLTSCFGDTERRTTAASERLVPYLTPEVFVCLLVLPYGSSLMLCSCSGFVCPALSSCSSAALLNLLRNPAGLLVKAV